MISALRPWGGVKATALFDVFEPCLSAADVAPVEKARMFASRLNNSIIVPLILKCPGGCPLLHSTCDYLLEVLNEANHCEVTDTFLQCALEMGGVIKPLWALSSTDLEVQAAHIDELGYLCKHMGKAGATLVCVIGAALRRSSWLAERLEKLMEKHAVLGEVATDMKEHREQLKEAGGIDIATRVASVGAACRCLTKLQGNFEKDFYQKFEKEVEQWVRGAIKAVTTVLEGGAWHDIDFTTLAADIREFSVALPHDGKITQLDCKIGSSLRKHRARGLAKALTTSCSALLDAAATQEIGAALLVATSLLDARRRAEGGALKEYDESPSIILKAAEACSNFAWGAGSDADRKVRIGATMSVLPFLEDDHKQGVQDQSDCLRGYLALQGSVKDYQGMVNDRVQEIIDAGAFDTKLLVAMRSRLKGFEEWLGRTCYDEDFKVAIVEGKRYEAEAKAS